MPAPPVILVDDEKRRALFAQFLKVVQRQFNLIERVPERFKKRGWACDDRLAIATLALCCVAMRRPDITMKVFPGTDDPQCWAKIVGVSTAEKIVEALELRDLIKSG